MNMGRAVAAWVTGTCALTAAGAASAENWVTFFITPAGVIYLDHDSLTRRDGFVSARLESTFPEPQKLNRNGRIIVYVKAIDRIELDCKARVYKNVSRDLYTATGLMQLSLNEQDNPIHVTANSPQEALIKAFCS